MFDINSVPSQKGRISLVTGANAGLGYETALALAKLESTVILACRNPEKAENAKQRILNTVPTAQLDILIIDLSELASVRTAAEEFNKKYERLDLLINNAGVMIPPYTVTKDGFELQFAANHLGHFLFTGLILDTLLKTKNARIVSLSSIAHKDGKIHFDDLHWEKKYSAIEAYNQSKLACIMYGFELQRRLEKAGHKDVMSVVAHPGVSITELARHIPSWLVTIMEYTIAPIFTHPPKEGALPTLMAALDSSVKGGEYFGPQGFNDMKGKPGRAFSTKLANDEVVAKQLWEVSEKLVGLSYLG